MTRFVIEKLDMHIADSCNLHCEQCDHFSNYIFQKVHSLETLEEWCKPWKDRILPQSFHMLGGEPLMNPQIVDIVYMVREMWQDSNIILWSNGLLAKKFPELPKALKETNTRFHVSNHSTLNSEVYDKKFNECIGVLQKWFEQYEPQITFQYNNGSHVAFEKRDGQYYMMETKVNPGEEGTLWEKFYHGHGKDMKPYNEGDPETSWRNCSAKCPQLYNGKIHKCAPLTFLPLMEEKFGLSEEWQPYLQYKGLEPDCTDEQLEAFFNLKAESFCGMCPKQRPKFYSNHNPLKVFDKGDI